MEETEQRPAAAYEEIERLRAEIDRLRVYIQELEAALAAGRKAAEADDV